RDEFYGDLRQLERRVRVGEYAVRERRQLDACVYAGTVHDHRRPLARQMDGAGDAVRHAEQVRRGRILEGAELLEITTTAEVRACAVEDDAGDRVIRRGDEEPVQQRLTHRGVEGVADVRTVQRQPQRGLLSGHEHD